MNAKLAVQILNVFVLLLLAFTVEGADVAGDDQKDKSSEEVAPKVLDPKLVGNSSKDDANSDPKVNPSGANAGPSPPETPKGTTPVPRAVIAAIKAHTFPPMPTLPLIGLFPVNNQNITCIVFKSGIRFTINYRNVTGGQMVNQSTFDVPVHNYTVEGQCLKDQQSLSIIFYPDTDLKWNLSIEFSRDKNSQNLAFSEKISLAYSLRTGAKPFPWARTHSSTAVYSTPGFFSLTLGSSYICMTNSKVSNFTQSTDSHVAEMRMYGMQVQAFKTEKNNTDFSSIIVQCSGDAVNSTVPLIVGLFILGLIIAVLIVFIFMRRRLDRRAAHKKLATEDMD